MSSDPPPHDIDLLIEPSRFDEAVATFIDDLGFTIRSDHRETRLKTAVGKFTRFGLLVLDLHAAPVQGGIIYLDPERVLERRRKVEDYYLPAATDLLTILVFHNVLGKQCIQSKHYSLMKSLSTQWNSRDLINTLTSPETAPIVEQTVAELDGLRHDHARVVQIGESIRAILSTQDFSSRWRQIRYRWDRVKRRFSLRPRAPLIAIMGVDGAGKSTLVDTLVRTLNEQGIARTRTVYMGPWGHYLLPFMRGLKLTPSTALTLPEWWPAIRAAQGVPFAELWSAIIRRVANSSTHQQVRNSSRIYLTLRMFYSELTAARFFSCLIIEMLWRYFIAYRYRRRGVTVIADRYIYDLMTGSMHTYLSRFNRRVRILCSLFFRPTMGFILSAPAELILSRKQDLKAPELDRFLDLYAKLADEYRFEVIDTDVPATQIATDLIARHFESFCID